MSLATEEAADAERRAQLYREQRQARMRYQAQLRAQLAGSVAAWQTLFGHWQPLLEWLREREQPGVEPEAELDPLGISDQVNVGR